MEPQSETAGQLLAQSALLPWEQAFYPGAPETVLALMKTRINRGNEHFIRSQHRLLAPVLCLLLELSPLVPGPTPTAGLDVYPVSGLVPCCFPLAKDTCVGGAVGRLKTLVGWLSC